jgi:flagellar hook-associated protein 3 FlgL
MGIEIKSLTPTQLILQLASKQQDELQKVSTQIASGNKHTDFRGFAETGDVERFVSLNQAMSSTTAFLQSNNVVSARITTMDQTVDQLQSIASDVAQLIAKRRNSASGEDVALTAQGQSILDNIAGRLNIKFDGSYLFSGTKTDTAPVVNIQNDPLDSSNGATALYYHGDSTQASIKISNSQEIQYGINANDQGFQELIGAVHLAINGDQENSDSKLALAMDMINNSIQNLASVRAQLGLAKQNIDEANATHNDTKLLVTQNLINVSQTNIVEATTHMSEIQATLQATYIAFQRLNTLRLSNYLN